MTDELIELVELAGSALAGPGLPIGDAAVLVPAAAGLYAVYGDREVWCELSLGRPPDGRPLYVGKAEDSLISRDLRTHFGSGRTGSSTLRRSFAALLAERLDLHAQPRNTAKPERPANYGLPAAEDQRLTLWMQSNLRLAVWEKRGAAPLRCIEQRLLELLLPPLNLAGVRTPWRGLVKSARSEMADQARAWMGQ